VSIVELSIGGMTGASCASRIERKLNRLDGVVATVNYATATARVELPARLELPDVVSTVGWAERAERVRRRRASGLCRPGPAGR
jgi:cation transport ATPase